MTSGVQDRSARVRPLLRCAINFNLYIRLWKLLGMYMPSTMHEVMKTSDLSVTGSTATLRLSYSRRTYLVKTFEATWALLRRAADAGWHT